MYKNSLSTDEYQNALKTAWRHFIKGENFDYSFIRKDILNSWKRSRDFGVEPVNTNYVNLSASELNFKINRNMQLINTVHPYLEKLFEMVKGSGSYILLCDKDGYIIDYKGDEDIIAQGNKTKLGMGSMRSEQSVGTNGIGTALYLKKTDTDLGRRALLTKTQGIHMFRCSVFRYRRNRCWMSQCNS